MDRLKQQQRRYILQDLALFGAGVLAAALALRLGVPPTVAIVTAAPVLGALLLALLVYLLNGRKARAAYRRLTTQDVWAHWQYRQGEWRSITGDAAVRADLARQAAPWRPLLLRSAPLLGLALAAVVLANLATYGLAGVAAALVVGACIFLISYRSAARVVASLGAPYPLRDGEPDDVYIGARGAVFPGNMVLFGQPRLHIQRASVEGEHPAKLRLALLYDLPRQQIPYDLLLPVPLGREEEAGALAARIGSELAKPIHTTIA